MTRTLAVLMAITVAACGSASKAGPKTSNPPLKQAPPKADPAAKPPVEVDGLTVKFNNLGFSLTFPNAEWSGEEKRGDGGQIFIVFKRAGSDVELAMMPLKAPGADAKAIATGFHARFSGDPSNTVGPLAEESGGRWGFAFEAKNDDGSVNKARMSAQPVPGKADAYLLAMTMGSAAEYDKHAAETVSVLDSLKALP